MNGALSGQRYPLTLNVSDPCAYLTAGIRLAASIALPRGTSLHKKAISKITLKIIRAKRPTVATCSI